MAAHSKYRANTWAEQKRLSFRNVSLAQPSLAVSHRQRLLLCSACPLRSPHITCTTSLCLRGGGGGGGRGGSAGWRQWGWEGRLSKKEGMWLGGQQAQQRSPRAVQAADLPRPAHRSRPSALTRSRMSSDERGK